jgi:hypothetical protein
MQDLSVPVFAKMTRTAKTVLIDLLKSRDATARGSHRRMMKDAGDRRRSHPARSSSGV